MKLVIDRKTWLRGEGPGVSALIRRSDGKQCCLGFLGLALGISRDNLLGRLAPNITSVDCLVKWTDGIIKSSDNPFYNAPGHTDVARELMNVNDYQHMSEVEREVSVKNLFSQIGIEVEFIN